MARKKVAKFSGISYKTISKGTCRYEYDDGEGTYEVRFKRNGRGPFLLRKSLPSFSCAPAGSARSAAGSFILRFLTLLSAMSNAFR